MSESPITETDVAAFDRDGAVCLRHAFDPRWLDRIAEGIDKELAAPGNGLVEQQAAGLPGRFVTDYCAAQRTPEFQDFIVNSGAAEIVATLMRSTAAHFLMDVLWIKQPGTAKPTAWHQDQPYFCIDGRQMCSIWLPIDPVPRDVALRFLRGSHRWGRWFRPRLTSGRELYTFGADEKPWEAIPDFDAELDKYDVLQWGLEPGDCLVFHALAVHGAPGNPQPSRHRRVLTTVWFGDDATYGVRPSPPRPHFEGHGLKPGDPMRSPYFPQIWPRPAGEIAGHRFSADTALRITI
ncbi:MAG TPA: phytanoyl-CoA dioxygenase family protein [Stellaceae bacterium]|nr:phytanoyl-CoA dioxygenase family protein [Stellaceae bacterium]